MADDRTKQSTPPLPNFRFLVRLGNDEVRFAEMAGLDADAKPGEFRHGNSPVFYPIKMPGLGRVGNVTMRKGTLAKNAGLWNWIAAVERNSIVRRAVVIKLLDEKGEARMTWTLHNAFPTRITGTDPELDGNDVAVESIELAYETVDVKTA
jgi:phage tail-like protein